MWACDVIPGVSWWTIAFITGIYDELIDSLHAINIKTIKLLLSGKIKSFRKEIHGNFLVTLFAGIFVSILTLVKVIDYLLVTYPVLLRAFFFGLILSSVFILRKSIKKQKKIHIILLLVWILIWFCITALPVMQLWGWNVMVFLSWVIAIVAMILPGISGSYILLILWKYQEIIWNVVDAMSWDISAIISVLIFIIGAFIGLIFFSKLLHYIKTRRHDQMMVILIGFMIWSLNKVRPRKETIETYLDRHWEIQPLLQKNILPTDLKDILITTIVVLIWFWITFWVTYFVPKTIKQ